ncbi:DUF808 domain-containing protein [Shewanella salipaludis]|uniref:DUF808 domain-containing protein n=1 Tax=Shewanella salipaludis TaxID=2723052 RepID=A0A972FVA8_9GAMM|nr:DUF808 domain-containing protein [Shewanella salipaludis]NMH66431.1 DUF808 domain-containing protein [Shewanella salipaludis]
MAGASLLTLLDDIASILDDVALMSKVAAKKTVGVLGDDLALNAQQVSGVSSERELPVVWAVAMGSFRNKLVLVPAAMLISAFIPWAVTPLLMLGGLFLCFEGFEKLHHSYSHRRKAGSRGGAVNEPIRHGTAPGMELTPEPEAATTQADAPPAGAADPLLAHVATLRAQERQKVKGAIRTDFVLSAEIIAITLGTVADAGLWTQFATLSIIAVIMTLGVYGLVAAIVKLDDVGLYLSRRAPQHFMALPGRRLGRLLLLSAPKLMKTLTLVGTAAMFMVGGGILTHGLHFLGDKIAWVAEVVSRIALLGPGLAFFTPSLLNGLFGIMVGGVCLLLLTGIQRLRG